MNRAARRSTEIKRFVPGRKLWRIARTTRRNCAPVDSKSIREKFTGYRALLQIRRALKKDDARLAHKILRDLGVIPPAEQQKDPRRVNGGRSISRVQEVE
jgi:hypothetical protein